MCKNINVAKLKIDYVKNSYIDENNISALGALTDDEKKFYLIYADTTYFKNLYELSFKSNS